MTLEKFKKLNNEKRRFWTKKLKQHYEASTILELGKIIKIPGAMIYKFNNNIDKVSGGTILDIYEEIRRADLFNKYPE